MNIKKLDRLQIIAALILLLWAIHLLGFILPLSRFGIRPRTSSGLIGIFCSPFLHANIRHLFANSTSFLLFALILISLERQKFFHILFFIMLVSGASTWLLARNANHIGASALIFGMFAYLLCGGIFRRQFKYIIISVIVAILYGGMIMGVFPGTPQVSWEGHLFGFCAGAIAAYYYNPKNYHKKFRH